MSVIVEDMSDRFAALSERMARLENLGFQPEVRSFGPLGPFYPVTSAFGCVGKKWVPPAKPWTVPDFEELPAIPSFDADEAEKSQPLPSPLKAWKYSHANDKIRKDARTYKFASTKGKRGLMHATTIASNEPGEDNMAVGAGPGVGGEKTVYAGVYDGHG